ncbi:MAG: rRNA maturation RNase YbeY [Anaerolineaceae bacterium]|nr:rRNA maturation RNase YbeY [Anaerolineaceae bacterium]
MINIIISEAYASQLPQYLIQETAQAVFRHQKVLDSSTLSIVIADNQRLKDLNRQFRSIDSPTDVLSFSSGEIDPETGQEYLGDIIISWQKAEGQARTSNQSVACEIRLLVIHGILHLLGFDHATIEEQKEMWAIQNQILEEFGCSSPDKSSQSA